LALNDSRTKTLDACAPTYWNRIRNSPDAFDWRDWRIVRSPVSPRWTWQKTGAMFGLHYLWEIQEISWVAGVESNCPQRWKETLEAGIGRQGCSESDGLHACEKQTVGNYSVSDV